MSLDLDSVTPSSVAFDPGSQVGVDLIPSAFQVDLAVAATAPNPLQVGPIESKEDSETS